MISGHQHGRRCYWDHRRCGWVCRRAGPFTLSADPARVDLDVLHRELAASYWSPGVAREVVARAVAGSVCVCALRDEAMIGFARLVTDRATFGWIADVVVVAPARGGGVGAALVRALLERADGWGLRRVALATADAHRLYRPLGFTDPPPGLLLHRTTPT